MGTRFWWRYYPLRTILRSIRAEAWRRVAPRVARHLPREVQRWVLVQLAVAAMGRDKRPEYATYITMCDVLDR